MCLNMLNNQVVIMKVIRRSKERTLKSEQPDQRVSKEVLKEIVHANVLTPIEIIDDASNDNIYLISPYMRAGSLEERIEDTIKERV